MIIWSGFHLTPLQVADGRVFAIQSDAIGRKGPVC